MRVRSAAAVALALLIVVFAAGAVFARGSGGQNDRRISVSGDIVVASGTTVHGPVGTLQGNVHVDGTVTDYVFVGDGNVYVSGHVTRGVVVVHGDAHISGRVGGDVVALSGRVFVSSGARVSGDVVSRLAPHIASGTVSGDVRRLDLRGIFTGIIIGFLAYLWIAVTISTALLGLVFVGLFPRAADTSVAAGRRVGPAIGWGALVGIVGPFVAVVVVATVVGIPLGLGMIAALDVLAAVGYVTSALLLGRIWVRGTSNGARIGAFFAGWGILRLLALIPGIGLLVWFGAAIYGIGAVSMAAWYGGRPRATDTPSGEPAPPLPPPAPTAPDTAPAPAVVGAPSGETPVNGPAEAPAAPADAPDAPGGDGAGDGGDTSPVSWRPSSA